MPDEQLLKVWIVKVGEFNPLEFNRQALANQQPDFYLKPSSGLLKGGAKGMIYSNEALTPGGSQLQDKAWFTSYIHYVPVICYVEATGLYRIANVNLKLGQLYLDKLRVREIKSDPSYIFVIMSFNPSNPSLEDSYQAMKRAADNVKINLKLGDLRLEKIDDKRGGAYSIPDEIFEAIKSSGIVIADITESKPNVYFELGYAKALNKEIIIVRHKNEADKAHFDIAHLRRIEYENATKLEQELTAEITAIFNTVFLNRS